MEGTSQKKEWREETQQLLERLMPTILAEIFGAKLCITILLYALIFGLGL
jgi:hypothetical protein